MKEIAQYIKLGYSQGNVLCTFKKNTPVNPQALAQITEAIINYNQGKAQDLTLNLIKRAETEKEALAQYCLEHLEEYLAGRMNIFAIIH